MQNYENTSDLRAGVRLQLSPPIREQAAEVLGWAAGLAEHRSKGARGASSFGLGPARNMSSKLRGRAANCPSTVAARQRGKSEIGKLARSIDTNRAGEKVDRVSWRVMQVRADSLHVPRRAKEAQFPWC